MQRRTVLLTIAMFHMVIACASNETFSRRMWSEMPTLKSFETFGAMEAGVKEVFESESFESLVVVNNVVYGNLCSPGTAVGGATGLIGVGGTTGATEVEGVTGSTGVGGATGSTGVGGATGSTGVGGATGSTGVGGVASAAGIGGVLPVVACARDAAGSIVRIPTDTRVWEFDGVSLRELEAARIVR